jgi:hypothetical protein
VFDSESTESSGDGKAFLSVNVGGPRTEEDIINHLVDVDERLEDRGGNWGNIVPHGGGDGASNRWRQSSDQMGSAIQFSKVVDSEIKGG